MNQGLLHVVTELRERYQNLEQQEKFFLENGMKESARTNRIKMTEVEYIANAVAIYFFMEGDGKLENGHDLLHGTTTTEVQSER